MDKPEIFTEFFSAISRLINVIGGSTADMTLSARAGRDELRIRSWIDWAFLKIAGEQDHCARCWEWHNALARQSLTQWTGANNESGSKTKKEEQA